MAVTLYFKAVVKSWSTAMDFFCLADQAGFGMDGKSDQGALVLPSGEFDHSSIHVSFQTACNRSLKKVEFALE